MKTTAKHFVAGFGLRAIQREFPFITVFSKKRDGLQERAKIEVDRYRSINIGRMSS